MLFEQHQKQKGPQSSEP